MFLKNAKWPILGPQKIECAFEIFNIYLKLTYEAEDYSRLAAALKYMQALQGLSPFASLSLTQRINFMEIAHFFFIFNNLQ